MPRRPVLVRLCPGRSSAANRGEERARGHVNQADLGRRGSGRRAETGRRGRHRGCTQRVRLGAADHRAGGVCSCQLQLRGVWRGVVNGRVTLEGLSVRQRGAVLARSAKPSSMHPSVKPSTPSSMQLQCSSSTTPGPGTNTVRTRNKRGMSPGPWDTSSHLTSEFGFAHGRCACQRAAVARTRTSGAHRAWIPGNY